jgi:hypothetical protein
MLVAIALKDIDAEKELIECLDGYKISKADMELMREYDFLFPQGSGKIVLNHDGTRQLLLLKIDYEDEIRKYQTILDVYEKARAEKITKAISLSAIKLNLHLLVRLGKIIGLLSSARFNFLKEPERVFIEFDNYKNSFALVMPMRNDENITDQE